MRIQGGTHLGIVSCFGEREFDTDDIEEVKNILLEEYVKEELPVSKQHYSMCRAIGCPSKDLEWTFQDRANGTWQLSKKGIGIVIFEIRQMLGE